MSTLKKGVFAARRHRIVADATVSSVQGRPKRLGKGAGEFMKSERPTGEEMAAYAAGIADAVTARRVLAAALTDPWVRKRIAALPFTDTETAPQETTARAEELRAVLLQTVRSTVGISPTHEGIAPEPNILQRAMTAAVSVVERVLVTGRQFLTLPCLAPAAAASASDLKLRRQSVTTSEGVRLEFQQLPGGPPYRLRIIVDANPLQAEGAPEVPLYDVAYLTLEEGGRGESSTAETLPNHHVLVIALNREGRGFTDFSVGGDFLIPGTTRVLPAPQAPLSLLSVTLSQNGRTQADK